MLFIVNGQFLKMSLVSFACLYSMFYLESIEKRLPKHYTLAYFFAIFLLTNVIEELIKMIIFFSVV